ncbi:MAG: GntR family transcriptional regulator [Pseudomonadota bacterium]
MSAERASAAEQAYRRIRYDIITGVHGEGARLAETKLAEALGLSRTPVREALSRLALEGFVTSGTGTSARVAPFPEDEIEQVFQIRVLLETYAARRAAQFATAEEIAELRALSESMSAHTPPRTDADFETLSTANERFHKLIMQAARSRRLAALLGIAVDVGMVLRTYRMYSERDLIRSSQHHHEITDAIAARAPDWAANVMASHLLAAAATAQRRPASQSAAE